MADDIIIHLRISESSNKALYDELSSMKRNRTKRVIELANLGLEKANTPTDKIINELKQDIYLLKHDVKNLQAQLYSGNVSVNPVFQVPQPASQIPQQTQPVSQVSQPESPKPTKPVEESEKHDTIKVSENTDEPLSSDAMDSLMSLLNG